MNGQPTMTKPIPKSMTDGLNDLLGFQLAEWRSGYAVLEVELDDRHKNRQGGLHGGVTASMIDAVTGYCGIYELDSSKRRGNVTVSLNINYISRPKGARLRATAELIRAGRRLYFASARVTDDQDTLIATAEAVYAYIEKQPDTDSAVSS